MMETEDQVTATADEERMSDMKSDTRSEILSGHESHPTNMDSNPAAKVKKAGELAVLSFKVGGEEVLRGYIDKFVTLNTTGRVIAFASNNVAPFKLWMTNNVGGPESKSKADKILQFLITEKKMTKMEAITIFKIGSGRWSKIRRSPDAKAPGKAYGLNGTQITDKDLSVLGAFVEGLDLIVSNQCGHLPAKRCVHKTQKLFNTSCR
jgi:hypothetical protein